MKKYFNITGVCIPENHFMVDIAAKIKAIKKMIERGEYFVMNRPRQYGKTTTIFMLKRTLSASTEFYPIKISFEGMGSASFDNEKIFIQEFFLLLAEVFELAGDKDLVSFLEATPTPESFNQLAKWLGYLVKRIGKKIVLMIDEVDKSSNNQLFLDFLGMLRNKYLQRSEGALTFHSVILVGVHDVKSLKLKIRPDSETKYNSPWNIAVNFEVDLSFNAGEIQTMLADYAREEQVLMDIPGLAERLVYYTAGYPFLVSLLCKIVDETILPVKTERRWQLEDLENAVQIALKQSNTNFESLIKNLENNPDLYNLLFSLVMNETELSFNPFNQMVALGILYGFFRSEGRKTVIHNRIYEQLIYEYMTSNLETSGLINFSSYNTSSQYVHLDGTLNMEKVLLKFQQFLAEQYAVKDIQFIERNGRLLFLAFIKPIINGSGFDFKEVQISEEKRLDVVITFARKKYIVELKLWRGEVYHQEGLRQLCDYLERQQQSEGYLLVYDLRKESGQAGQSAVVESNSKTIFIAWV